ncbi:uncharacterized protein BCR38DRAFT_487005 [Pseudomassariella vexata]|uniref:Glycan binding protein Y3-like domain-containing protein n=1 Tax=Pseudomassariella vexata TaxID=1141098 RepID=A0A1Y2DRE2_9PEZI|nr:uncharacterized protein BCR38DRAFT_487005 [Pseudomassariella vexata]ORY61245.1 hypothetical protein BCR38DRAFT_487005 [Pseudomassariella vexata]
MQFTTLVNLALAATTAMALPSVPSAPSEVARNIEKRGCYTSGASWGSSKDFALQMAGSACNSALGQRTYVSASPVIAACYNIDTNKKVNFQVSKISSGDKFLSFADCYDGLQKEINGCGQGGDSSYTNWRYISDPNDGLC